MRESPAEASEDSQNDSKPQTQDTSQNSNSETDSKTFVEVDSTPRFRKGFRRKKGESPYVCDMNVKFKKEKKQSTFLNPDPNFQRYLIRQEGIPKTGQGIQCKVMEYTFCHFIIIFVKYNK